MTEDPRIAALPDIHGHAKGEHKPFAEERPIPYTARMLFLWFYHACRRGSPRFLMVADHMNYLTFEDPAAVNLVRRALKLAQAGDLYGAAETAGVDLGHAQIVSEGLRKGIRYSIGAEVDNDPRCRPDAQNIVDAMRPDGMIRSVHFLSITHPQHGENWMWPFDNPEFAELFEVVGTERVWEIYMATLLEAIEKLPGHIVAHFYVPAKFGHWPDDAALDGYEDRLLDACAERSMAVEVNSRYIYKFYAGDDAQLERFRAAHVRLLRKAKAKGVAIAVGSDAHSPKDQGRAFEAVLALLDEAEINEIAFPINGRLARVALRATEEILRQQSAAAAPQPAEAAVPSSNGSSAALPEGAAPVPVAVAGGAEAAPSAVPEPAKKRPARKRAPSPAETKSDAVAPPAELVAETTVAEAAHADAREHVVARTVVETADGVAVEAEAAPPEAPVALSAEPEAPVAESPVAESPVAEPDSAEPDVAEPVIAVAVAQIPAGEAATVETVAVEDPAVVEEPAAEEAPGIETLAGQPAENAVDALAQPAGSVDDATVDALPEPLAAVEPAAARAKPAVKAKPRTKSAPVKPPDDSGEPAKPVVKAAARPAARTAATKSRPAKAAPAKPVAKKAVAPKPAAKKAAPKTAASKKIAPRPAAKPAAKKAAPKKAAAARLAPAKAPKKAPAKRSAPAKKTAAKKAAKKKNARPRR